MKFLCVLFVVAFGVVAVGLGYPAVRRLDRDGRLTGIETGVLSFGVGALIVHLGVFAVGQVRLDGFSMGLLSTVLVLMALPGLRVVARAQLGAAAAGLLRRDDRVLLLLWAAAGFVAISSLLQGLAPPNDFDSLMYHMALPAMDIEHGRIAPNFMLGMAHAFFPPLLENLVRLALATVGEGAAQMFSAAFGIAAAFAAGALACRAGYGERIAVLAGLMFLAVRAVVWEMATAEVEVALAAFCVAAILAYLLWRDGGGFGAAVLFGLMLGGAFNVKYMGLAFAASFAPAVLWDLWRRRVCFAEAVAAGAVALAVFAPHMVRTFALTDNPLYPLFGRLFGGAENNLMEAMTAYGRGLGPFDLIRAPWDIFVFPAHFFDGFVFGAPYLLAFLPFGVWVFAAGGGAGRAVLSVVGVFFILWFYTMGQQVRFLIAVAPVVCAVAAAGFAAVWAAVASRRLLAGATAVVTIVLAANQAMFVGVYAALRLPPALGLMSPAEYHARTPTMQGAFYKTCTYIRDRLKPGERYLSLLNNTFYYCPQTAAIRDGTFPDEARFWFSGTPLPPLDLATFTERLAREPIRFVIVQTRYENRRNPAAKEEFRPVHVENSRFGRFVVPAVADLKPLAKDSISAVYDGPAVLARLKAMAAETGGK